MRVSMCHCFACQQRTGSVFGVQARFKNEQIKAMQGEFKTYLRTGDSGSIITFKFCPHCASTLCWTFEAAGMEDFTEAWMDGGSKKSIRWCLDNLDALLNYCSPRNDSFRAAVLSGNEVMVSGSAWLVRYELWKKELLKK